VAKTLGRTVTREVKQGQMICFEGLDGAGKTTVARSVVARLGAKRVSVELVERKDPQCDSPALTERMKLLRRLIWQYGDIPIQELGHHHALYNMASWFSALDLRKIRPLLAAGVIVVVDNWYYKFLSRFILKRAIDESHLRACFSHLTRPAAVFYLDVDPEVAAERKEDFNKGPIRT
jgi:thymidylate kinase